MMTTTRDDDADARAREDASTRATPRATPSSSRRRARDDADADDATPTMNDFTRSRTVSFAREDDLERSMGVADAAVDRADVWELPRTCDSCALYILPGCARWACARCLEDGVEYDVCAACRARAAREEAAVVRGKKGGKGVKKKRKVGGHAHGCAAFVLAEAPDEEEEEET